MMLVMLIGIINILLDFKIECSVQSTARISHHSNATLAEDVGTHQAPTASTRWQQSKPKSVCNSQKLIPHFRHSDSWTYIIISKGGSQNQQV